MKNFRFIFYPELPDLSHLTQLTRLNCSRNKLTSLPPLPSSLKNLICVWNPLTSLGDLRYLTNLVSLDAQYCDIKEIQFLPESLETLTSPTLDTTFSILPDSLEWIYCRVGGSYMLLEQHNKRREFIGWQRVTKFPSYHERKTVTDLYLEKLYELDGEKYNEVRLS